MAHTHPPSIGEPISPCPVCDFKAKLADDWRCPGECSGSFHGTMLRSGCVTACPVCGRTVLVWRGHLVAHHRAVD